MSTTHTSDIYPEPATPTQPSTLAHAWAQFLATAWSVAWRRPGAHRQLREAVEGLASALADHGGLDELGRDAAEVQAEADRIAELEALGDGGQDDEEVA